MTSDFSGGPVVKNPPANAGEHGFNSWSGRIPHAAEQLSSQATTTESACPTACAPQWEKPPQREIPHCNKERPPLTATREKKTCGNKHPVQPKVNKISLNQ